MIGADLFHRLLMVVDEVDDLAMRRRQLGDAGAQDGAGGAAVERGFRGVGLVGDLKHVLLVDVLVPALAQRGQRLEAGDRQQPGGNLRAAFELVAVRQTSRNTWLVRSSAMVVSRTMRRMKR